MIRVIGINDESPCRPARVTHGTVALGLACKEYLLTCLLPIEGFDSDGDFGLAWWHNNSPADLPV